MLRTWKQRRVVKQDARLKMLTEIMQGIRIIKFMVVGTAKPVPLCAAATY